MDIRKLNGILAGLILVFFFGHSFLGGMSLASGVEAGSAVPLVIWAAFAVMVCHMAVSIVTSANMLADKERPPSKRKKLHLVLKWITGVLLLALVLAHALKWDLALCAAWGVNADLAFRLGAALLVAVLAWHGFVGVKSLLKDLHMRTESRRVFRIVICIAAVIIIAIILLAL